MSCTAIVNHQSAVETADQHAGHPDDRHTEPVTRSAPRGAEKKRPPGQPECKPDIDASTESARRARRDIVARFARGDHAATELLYERYAESLRAVARRVLADPSLVEDAVQQCFVNAWRQARRYDDRRPMGPWLCQIARNAAVDLVRREARARRIHERSIMEPVTPTSDHFDLLHRQTTAGAVREVLASLEHADRELLRLLFYEELPQREVAERLGIAVGTVKSRAHRLLRKLSISVELVDCERVEP